MVSATWKVMSIFNIHVFLDTFNWTYNVDVKQCTLIVNSTAYSCVRTTGFVLNISLKRQTLIQFLALIYPRSYGIEAVLPVYCHGW